VKKKKEQSVIPPALTPLFTDKCILLSELHARTLITRALQSPLPQARVPMPAEDSTVDTPSREMVAGDTALISLVGIITKYSTFYDEYFGLCPAYELIREINRATFDPTVKQIVIMSDSPGGFVNGSVELADAVAAADKIKPVYGFIHGLCFSGAYYILSQCREIYGRREAEIGNIGVYSVLTDVSKAWECLGVTMTLVASERYKGLGADGKVTQDLIDETKRIISGLYEQFKTAVATGRGMTPQQVAAVSDGRVYLGPDSLSLGLIDGIASTVDDVVETISGTAAERLVMAKARTAAANQAANQGIPKAGDGGAADPPKPPTNDEVREHLSAATNSANGHKDQSRKTMDAYSAMTEESDANTAESAKQASAALRACSEESLRCADVLEGNEDEPDDDDAATKAAKAAAASAAATPPAVFTAQEYIAAFGDAGARWFCENKPFAVATSEFVGKLQAAHKTEADALKAENTALKNKLAGVDRGNPPATFDVPKGEGQTGKKSKLNNLSDNTRRFAEGIRMPGVATAE